MNLDPSIVANLLQHAGNLQHGQVLVIGKETVDDGSDNFLLEVFQADVSQALEALEKSFHSKQCLTSVDDQNKDDSLNSEKGLVVDRAKNVDISETDEEEVDVEFSQMQHQMLSLYDD